MGNQERRPLEDRQGRRPPGDACANVRIDQARFRPDLLLEGGLLAEEELEFQQVAPGEGLIQAARDRLAASVPRRYDDAELDDRTVDEPVDRAVAVVCGDGMLAWLDMKDRSEAAVVTADHARLNERAQHLRDAARAVQIAERGGRQLAPRRIVQKWFDYVMHLLQGERTVVGAEQGEGDERRRGDRRDPVDALKDLESDLVERPPRLLVPARKRLAQGEGFSEAHIGFAELSSLRPHIAGEPAEPLLRLGSAGFLGRHRPDLLQLVVGYRHGNEQDVVGAAAVHRLDEIPEETVPGGPELARSRPAAFHVPFEISAGDHEIAHVFTQHELVDLVVLEAAPDEHAACPTAERADREEPEIVSADDVIAAHPDRVKDVHENEGVGIGAVCRQEDQRFASIFRLHAPQRRPIDVEGPGASLQGAEPSIEEKAEERDLDAHHRAQRDGRLPARLAERFACLLGDGGKLGLEPLAAQQLVRHRPAGLERHGISPGSARPWPRRSITGLPCVSWIQAFDSRRGRSQKHSTAQSAIRAAMISMVAR